MFARKHSADDESIFCLRTFCVIVLGLSPTLAIAALLCLDDQLGGKLSAEFVEWVQSSPLFPNVPWR